MPSSKKGPTSLLWANCDWTGDRGEQKRDTCFSHPECHIGLSPRWPATSPHECCWQSVRVCIYACILDVSVFFHAYIERNSMGQKNHDFYAKIMIWKIMIFMHDFYARLLSCPALERRTRELCLNIVCCKLRPQSEKKWERTEKGFMRRTIDSYKSSIGWSWLREEREGEGWDGEGGERESEHRHRYEDWYQDEIEICGAQWACHLKNSLMIVKLKRIRNAAGL